MNSTDESRLSDQDLRLLKEAQDGLDLTLQPYQELGRRLGLTEEDVLSRLADLIERGVVRRVSATIGHRALGISANAMIAWNVPEGDVERVGNVLATLEDVTHCYERDAVLQWPYNLYTMIHTRTREEGERRAAEIASFVGVSDYRVLFSEREFKKTSARI
ncbi:MAG: putative HTH-type transcriptional regulator [Methanosaeta sp. PtaB.Bin039]|nr:MAG: putative HTH-type transcriptional regulator [Methanosaeta sp. PtaB.Bin039]HOT07512.1 Lrp/AsnC family transcriptional regulator [Methanotrichaceae archaeon]HQF16110.1 Lrp/AsnC family transcriptional regulator [Methanotrichaceae archaeon]HQI90776.1 Lrp/AsnC family transcriptional regulator [Methanotrichaceae archaeon]HQJ28268.1 Lrp/AsnC family transcriptional regulator [Methanotrichaceae archaeon]